MYTIREVWGTWLALGGWTIQIEGERSAGSAYECIWAGNALREESWAWITFSICIIEIGNERCTICAGLVISALQTIPHLRWTQLTLIWGWVEIITCIYTGYTYIFHSTVQTPGHVSAGRTSNWHYRCIHIVVGNAGMGLHWWITLDTICYESPTQTAIRRIWSQQVSRVACDTISCW